MQHYMGGSPSGRRKIQPLFPKKKKKSSLFTGTHILKAPPFTSSSFIPNSTSNKKRNSREMEQEESSSSRKQKRQRINPLPSSILKKGDGHRSRMGEEGSKFPTFNFFEQFAFPQRDESDAEHTEPHDDIPQNLGRNNRISAKPKLSKKKSNLPLFSSTPSQRFSFTKPISKPVPKANTVSHGVPSRKDPISVGSIITMKKEVNGTPSRKQQSAHSKVDELQKEINVLKAKVKRGQDTVQKLQNENASYSARIDKLEHQNNSLESRITGMEERFKELVDHLNRQHEQNQTEPPAARIRKPFGGWQDKREAEVNGLSTDEDGIGDMEFDGNLDGDGIDEAVDIGGVADVGNDATGDGVVGDIGDGLGLLDDGALDDDFVDDLL